MNRETLDGIVKQGLIRYAEEQLRVLGHSIVEGPDVNWSAGVVRRRERALWLLTNDAKRAAIVDVLLKEMNS